MHCNYIYLMKPSAENWLTVLTCTIFSVILRNSTSQLTFCNGWLTRWRNNIYLFVAFLSHPLASRHLTNMIKWNITKPKPKIMTLPRLHHWSMAEGGLKPSFKSNAVQRCTSRGLLQLKCLDDRTITTARMNLSQQCHPRPTYLAISPNKYIEKCIE